MQQQQQQPRPASRADLEACLQLISIIQRSSLQHSVQKHALAGQPEQGGLGDTVSGNPSSQFCTSSQQPAEAPVSDISTSPKGASLAFGIHLNTPAANAMPGELARLLQQQHTSASTSPATVPSSPVALLASGAAADAALLGCTPAEGASALHGGALEAEAEGMPSIPKHTRWVACCYLWCR
jgi:hypothetical protein